MKILIDLLPSEYKKDKSLKFRLIVINNVNLGAIIYGLLLTMYAYYIDNLWLVGFSIFFICFLLSFLTLLSLKLFRNWSVIENYYMISLIISFTGGSVATGGIHSPIFMWIVTTPIIVFLYTKKYKAIWWTLFTIVVSMGIMLNTHFGWIKGQPIPENHIKVFTYVNFMVLFISMTGVVNAFRNRYSSIRRKMQSANKDLEDANEDLRSFAFIASNDLQTPLKNIEKKVKNFKAAKQTTLDPIEEKCLNFIENDSRRLATLIEEILSHSNSDDREIQVEEIDLNTIVDEIRNQVENAGQYENYTIKSSNLGVIHSDRVMIFQLFQNITENGLKYNRNEHRAIIIEQVMDKGRHHITFTDNGIGIADKDHDKVFGMFSRVESVSNEFKGTGIGMATCKKMIEQAGGKIWFESTEGEGSIFHLEIPIVRDLPSKKNDKENIDGAKKIFF